MKPKGKIGNPRNYASKPNDEYVKDPRTGTYHPNTAFKGKKDKGKAGKVKVGIAAPPSVRRKKERDPSIDDHEVGRMMEETGLVFTSSLYRKTRDKRDKRYRALEKREGYDSNADIQIGALEETPEIREALRKTSVATSEMAEAFAAACESGESTHPKCRTEDRRKMLRAVRSRFAERNEDRGTLTPIPSFVQTGQTPDEWGGAQYVTDSAFVMQHMDLSSEGDLVVATSYNLGENDAGGGYEAGPHDARVSRFRDGKWETLTDGGPTPDRSKLFTRVKRTGVSRPGARGRRISPDPYYYGVMDGPDGRKMTDKQMVASMYHPIPREAVDAAVRDMDILIARAAPRQNGNFGGRKEDWAISGDIAALDALGPQGNVRREIEEGLRYRKIKEGMGAAKRLGVGHPTVRAKSRAHRLREPENTQPLETEESRRFDIEGGVIKTAPSRKVSRRR